jgi:KipI family sensor histidine kinase inhibitor
VIPASDASLLVSYGTDLSAEAHREVLDLLARLDGSPLPGILDLSPAAASILIRFDPRVVEHAAVEAHVRLLLSDAASTSAPARRVVEIPVVYGGAEGPDLDDVARAAGLAPDEVARRHAATVYDVLFLGFLPGFAYLGRVPETIACPRLPAPRREVPAGSVGIAGPMTAVYPMATPGGWRLIGRTEARVFDPARRPMALLQAGDQVRFVAARP